MLDPETRRELRSLSKETSDLVARHLVVTGRLLDDEPEQALTHARAARALAGRIGVVRLATGLAAYAAGEWNEALSELRAARRITGRPEHLAVLADCERGLGRPERALAYGDDPQVPTLSQDERVELVIVLAGARRDMGQADAAVLALQDPARRTTAARPWAARLWYAYADALLGAGREPEAREWFGRTMEVDAEGQTDVVDRLLALDGVVLDDLGSDDDDDTGMTDAELAAYVGQASLSAAVVIQAPVAEQPVAAQNAGAEGVVEQQAPEDKADVSAVTPFFGHPEPVAPVASARPAAALTPTFEAPADDDSGRDQAKAEDRDEPGAQDGDDLTLFS